MICLNTVKRFCKEYWKIENYQEAVNDTTQTWCCHHRKEIDWNMSVKELISNGLYYNVPANDLIFLIRTDHTSLHHKGKIVSNETKIKLRDTIKNNGGHTGNKNGMYGKHHTEESKAKQSATIKSKGGYSGENNPNYGKFKYIISYEELYDLYTIQGLSCKSISKIYGCSTTTIWLKLKKYNIIKNGR